MCARPWGRRRPTCSPRHNPGRSHASRNRYQRGSLRDRRMAWCRRYGRGLPRAGSSARARSGDQADPRDVREGRRPVSSLRAGGARGRSVESSQCPDGLRRGRAPGCAVRGVGAARGRVPPEPVARRAARASQSNRLCAPDRRGTGRRARQRHRPPRPETGQRLRDQRRTGEDPRLRDREAHTSPPTTPLGTPGRSPKRERGR